MGGDVGGHLDLAALEAPPERRPQVRQLRLHPVDLGPPPGTVPALPPPDRLAREVRRVPVAGRLALIGLRQPLVGERPDGLEQAVPGPRGAVVGDDEGLAHQRVEQPQHLDVVARLGDGAQRRQVEAAGEHRRRAQHRALVVVQQVVGPRHRVPQRRLAIRPELGPGQQPEPVAEPVPHLDRAHRRHPRRGQLDAERQPVEGLADLGSPASAVCSSKIPNPGRTARGPLDEQRHRVGRHATVDGQRRHRQRAPRPARAGAPARSRGRGGRRSGRGSRRSPPRPPRARARSCRRRAARAVRPAPRPPCR